VNGTTAYSSLVAWDNPSGAEAMLRVRDRVIARLAQHPGVLSTITSTAPADGPRLYGVDARAPWAAFSVISQPARDGAFRWHYDAESGDEYRALFVARGGDDCGEPAVHYRGADGAVHHLIVKTGHGYLIRGSQVSN